MKAFWHGLLAIVAVGMLAGGVTAADAGEGDILTAKQAYDKARAGEVILIDIRTPREWRNTGVPRGGVPETIHQEGGLPAFAEALLIRLSGDKAAPVALICASGGRSAYAGQYLERAGFTNVSDVAEGMAGGPNGPGWRNQGLPVDAWRRQ